MTEEQDIEDVSEPESPQKYRLELLREEWAPSHGEGYSSATEAFEAASGVLNSNKEAKQFRIVAPDGTVLSVHDRSS